MFTILIFLWTHTLWAYENAEEFCQKNPISGIGRFHKVIDEDFPNEEFFIHSYVKKTFDATRPSILFFSGGPGSSPRSTEFDLKNYNVIFFEQRGMGCSRPGKLTHYLDPKFYSSEKSASDVLQIAKDYGLKEVIAYGHSYGTVLATIFASKYPNLIHRVVLEGTIGVGDLKIWKSERRRELLLQTFQQLPDDLQKQIIYYSGHEKLPTNWFSVVGNMMTYLDNAQDIYANFLGNVLQMEESSFVDFISTFYPAKGFSNVSPEDAEDGEVTFGMITCQELSGSNLESSMNLIFDQKKNLIWDNVNLTRKDYCLPLGLSLTSNPIDLKNYPLRVPVTYLVGENDGATDQEQARYHARFVARGLKQFYMLKKGGHLPNLGALKEDRECRDTEDCNSMKAIKTQVKFFEKILSSELPLTPVELSAINENLDFIWVLE